MMVLVCADEDQMNEIGKDKISGIKYFDELSTVNHAEYDAVFLLNHIPDMPLDPSWSSIPVFINEVIHTSSEMKFPANVIRINGWPGFLQREAWEAAGAITEEANAAAQVLGRRLLPAPDIPGLVAARVIAAIVNEAHQALNEKISSVGEIDLALRAGTNYPFGPFEWSDRIGPEKLYNLLLRMAETDAGCQPLFSI